MTTTITIDDELKEITINHNTEEFTDVIKKIEGDRNYLVAALSLDLMSDLMDKETRELKRMFKDRYLNSDDPGSFELMRME